MGPRSPLRTIVVVAGLIAAGLVYRERPQLVAQFLYDGLRVAVPWLFLTIVLSLGMLAIVSTPKAVLRLIQGLRCPSCGSGEFRCQHVRPFGFRYFGCPSCGARWKRPVVGPWIDASGPEDAHHYRARERLDPWTVSGEEFEPATARDGGDDSPTAAARLVRLKRLRSGTSPSRGLDDPVLDSFDEIDDHRGDREPIADVPQVDLLDLLTEEGVIREGEPGGDRPGGRSDETAGAPRRDQSSG